MTKENKIPHEHFEHDLDLPEDTKRSADMKAWQDKLVAERKREQEQR